MLQQIQQALFDEAAERRAANIVRGIDTLEALKGYFAEDQRYPGWAEVQWSRPEGAALDKVVEQLKALKLTFRNVPMAAAPANGICLFTGEPAVERILVARAY
jgi:prolyl-tRNA synthetase